MAETLPILTQGIEPTSGEPHSPTGVHGTWGSKDGNVSNKEWNDAEANTLPEKVAHMNASGELDTPARKRVVVVGLGMVGIAFMYVVTVQGDMVEC
jgi:nitrite reductase (NAD(P)H)